MGNQDKKHEGSEAKQVKRIRSSPCDDDDDDDDGGGATMKTVENPLPLYECNICGKAFTKPQALGGHKRWQHFQSLNKKEEQDHDYDEEADDQNMKRSSSPSDDDDDGASAMKVVENPPPLHECNICGKSFTRAQGLGCHKRLHFKALKINPQNNNMHNSSSSSCSSCSYTSSMEEKEDNQDWRVNDVKQHLPAIDLSKFTSPSWGKTDKRGRICIHDEVISSEFLPPKKRKLQVGEYSYSDEGNVVKKKAKFSLDDTFNSVNKSDHNGAGGKSKGLLSEEPDQVGRISELKKDSSEKILKTEVISPVKLQDHEDGDYFDERKVNSLYKGCLQKSKTDSSSTSGNEAQKNYKCGICGKAFSTFQGLGAHRSIHKQKSKITIEDNSSFSKMDETTDPPVQSGATLAADGEASQSTTGQKEFDFDLNEPYLED